jgi:hypothetical protein
MTRLRRMPNLREHVELPLDCRLQVHVPIVDKKIRLQSYSRGPDLDLPPLERKG